MTMPTPVIELDGVGIEAETLQGVVITYGRARTSDTCEPSTATISIITPPQPWSFSIGSEVIIDGEVSAVAYRRFTGTVVQVDAGKYITTLTCTSAGLGACAAAEGPDYTITNWRNGFDSPMAQILYRAGLDAYGPAISYNFDNGTTEPINPYMLASGTALQQLQEIAALDIQGLIWEEQDGTIRFDDVSARSSVTPFTDIEADTVSERWTASQTVFSIINRVTLNFNDGTETLLMEDTVSQGIHGVRSYTENFDVDNSTDASLRASKILAGYSDATWITNPITVELTSISTAAKVAKMLQLQVGTPIDLQEVTDEIDVVPPDAFVEGYTETIYANTWSMELWVSDVRVTRTPQSWATVTPTLTWATVSPATLTWYDSMGVVL